MPANDQGDAAVAVAVAFFGCRKGYRGGNRRIRGKIFTMILIAARAGIHWPGGTFDGSLTFRVANN